MSHLILRVKLTGWESLTMAISESRVLESQAGCWMAREILMSTGVAPSLLVLMSAPPRTHQTARHLNNSDTGNGVRSRG